MSKKWILVVDSGNGGLWTLSKIRELSPNENYLFFMDTKNSPYGNKSKKTLKKIAEKNIKKIYKKFDIKLVVLACNTLSSVCYEDLKELFFDTPIIKINPMVNCNFLHKENTLVLATKCTIKNNCDIKKYKGVKNIYFKGFGKLAKKIDDNFEHLEKLQLYLFQKLIFFFKNSYFFCIRIEKVNYKKNKNYYLYFLLKTI